MAWLSVAWAALLAAQPAAPSVGFGPFEGPGHRVLARAAAASLRDAGVTLVSARRADVLLSESARAQEVDFFLATARGERIASVRYRVGRRLLERVRSTLARRLWPTLHPRAVAAPVAAAPTRPPPEPAPPPPAPPASIASPSADEGETAVVQEAPPPVAADERPWPVILDLSLGGGSLGHWLDYKDDLFSALGSYALAAGPLVGGGAAFYPGALATRGVFAHLGLIGDFYHTVGLSSSVGGTSFPTIDDRWSAGLRIRIPIGDSEVGAAGRYGEQDFRMGAVPGTPASPIPDYTYTFAEGSLDSRIQIGFFALLLEAAYVGVLDDGIEKSGFFPHATVGALDGGLHLGFAVWEGVELRLGADYQRYFFSFNSVPGDAHVAGGAVDQYVAATLALAVRVR